METVTVTIRAEKEVITPILQALKRMQYNGSIGHSEFVGVYADGDGRFRPEIIAYQGDCTSEKKHEVEIRKGTQIVVDGSTIRWLINGAFYE